MSRLQLLSFIASDSCQTPRYTILWNVTYGTSTDSTIANLTSCDLSRLSYQSFFFNKSISVVAPISNGAILPGNTKEERTFEPTGLIMSNAGNAIFVMSNIPTMFFGVLCVVLQAI